MLWRLCDGSAPSSSHVVGMILLCICLVLSYIYWVASIAQACSLSLGGLPQGEGVSPNLVVLLCNMQLACTALVDVQAAGIIYVEFSEEIWFAVMGTLHWMFCCGEVA